MRVPLPTKHDGSPVGNSYISLWYRCRRKWFAKYWWPWPDGKTGLGLPGGLIRLGRRGLIGPGANLMLGSMLHAFKEAWYLSGVRDGEDTGQYNLEAALEHLNTYTTARQGEFAPDTGEGSAFDWALAEVKKWCELFHTYYGPDGYTPLFPEEKVLCLEDGRPAVELQFEIPLGYRDYIYTTRLDAVKLFQDRYVIGSETKTAAASWVERYINRLPKGSQFTGQMFVLRNAPELAHLPWDKVKVVYHIKGWNPSGRSMFTSPCVSGDVTRSQAQLQRFQVQTLAALRRIDETVEEYQHRLEAGEDFYTLLDELFPESGENTGECYSFNSECEFMTACRMGFDKGSLGNFHPARAAADEEDGSEEG